MADMLKASRTLRISARYARAIGIGISLAALVFVWPLHGTQSAFPVVFAGVLFMLVGAIFTWVAGFLEALES